LEVRAFIINTIGLFETYESNIKPIFWKGTKAVVVSLRCIENQKVKGKLLIDQANEICFKFEEMINMLQAELLEDSGRSETSLVANNIFLISKLLISANKIYTEFQFMKDVLEMDNNDLRIENQRFSLIQYLLYSIDLVLSCKIKSKVNIFIDPCMPEEVEGDLNKFRQIITAIVDFSLKSTGEIHIKVLSYFIKKTGGFRIVFSVIFQPEFNISKYSSKYYFRPERARTITRT
jgi:hypothetical protein